MFVGSARPCTMACRSLHEGESDLALAGGATVMLEPRKSVVGSAQGMLSPTGRCHAFDVAADGFVSAEGCAVRVAQAACPMPCGMATGSWLWCAAPPPTRMASTVNIATPSLDGAGRGVPGGVGRGGRGRRQPSAW